MAKSHRRKSRMAARPFSGKSGQVFKAGEREYKLGGAVGDGAIGVVRKAQDRESERIVAVKFLAPEPRYVELASVPDIAARFRREGLRGISLHHPNLVQMLAYEDNEDGSCFRANDGPAVPFIVMEYVKGNSLESVIKASGPPKSVVIDDRTLFIAHQISEALVFLHEKKVVHRDVKPANIFLSSMSHNGKPRTVKLGDFGVCKWSDFKGAVATGALTVTGQRGLGTMKYMPPEQAINPKNVTVRSDMYSLGVTLFELFTSQILPSPHHVFQLTQARMKRGAVGGKLVELGLGYLPPFADDILGPILDMVLTGMSGRPTSKAIRGRLLYLLGQLEDA